MRYAYYPGCSLEGSARDYSTSVAAISQPLGLQLEELEDWNCCGASSAHALDERVGISLPARNLALAESTGLDLVTPCAACYNRLASAHHRLERKPELRGEVAAELGLPYQGSVRPRALIEVVMSDVGSERLRELVSRPLGGLRPAAYYGCLLVRPAYLGLDDPERPRFLDDLLTALGAQPVEWSHGTECCGGHLGVSRPEVATRLVGNILAAAEEAGAEALVTACPMCQANLELRQAEAGRRRGRAHNLPVYYFTDLIGLALGLSPETLGLPKHLWPGWELLKTKGIWAGGGGP